MKKKVKKKDEIPYVEPFKCECLTPEWKPLMCKNCERIYTCRGKDGCGAVLFIERGCDAIKMTKLRPLKEMDSISLSIAQRLASPNVFCEQCREGHVLSLLHGGYWNFRFHCEDHLLKCVCGNEMIGCECDYAVLYTSGTQRYLKHDCVHVCTKSRGWRIECCNRAPIGRCAIATAALGTSAECDLDALRAFRDEVIVPRMPAGEWLSSWYDQIKYPVAEMVKQNRILKIIFLYLFVVPTLALLKQKGVNKYRDAVVNWVIFVVTFLPMLAFATIIRACR